MKMRQEDVVRKKICSAGNTLSSHMKDITVSSAFCLLYVEGEQQYLVVHDRSQAHDAHVHVVLLAHQAGVLDGFAVRNRAIAATDGQSYRLDAITHNSAF